MALAAKEAAALSERDVVVVPTRDMPQGLSVLLALATVQDDPPGAQALMEIAGTARSASLFFAGKDSALGGVTLKRGAPAVSIGGRISAALELGAAEGGALALYYGGIQKERDARALAATLEAACPAADVEYYYGGQHSSEYVISLDR